MAPLLSICVPSRNRQKYFKKTIEALVASMIDDVEFVFADNSDDPTIMDGFVADILRKDRRVVYLPSEKTVLSMVDNWERAVEATTGDWVVVIGDDDYVDPSLATFLQSITKVEPDLEALGWMTMHYRWPHEGGEKSYVYVTLEDHVVKVSKADCFRRMFDWHEATHVPTSGFSIYHSAISRVLLERIRKTYSGRYFEHPVVDYDNAFKVICSGRNFAVSVRPFSIMGSCPDSNSFSLGKIELYKKRIREFIGEAGRDFENDTDVRDFPFKSILGTPATIIQAQNWFKKKYKLKHEGWEKNFVQACMHDVSQYHDLEAFTLACEGYRTALRTWKNGRYLKDFTPTFAHEGEKKAIFVTGFTSHGVHIDTKIAETPGKLFALVEDMITAAEHIQIDPTGLKFPWELHEPDVRAAS
ncbi:MAG: hypothetical protein BGO05_27800 [Rhizobiales bacterium 63-7]|nr:glycosyltransferase family 2 protein [Hyphomicrobiales bacterium]OJU66027.1 MAG: hypothetical protein BGO05_27800 [Rhizobiales bacterium 63-7]